MSLITIASSLYAGTAVAGGALSAIRQMIRPRRTSRVDHYLSEPALAFSRVVAAPVRTAADYLATPVRVGTLLVHGAAIGLAAGVAVGVNEIRSRLVQARPGAALPILPVDDLVAVAVAIIVILSRSGFAR